MELDKLDETCKNRRTFDIYSERGVRCKEKGGFQEMINDAAVLRVFCFAPQEKKNRRKERR